jgi:hypothetical protein
VGCRWTFFPAILDAVTDGVAVRQGDGRRQAGPARA